MRVPARHDCTVVLVGDSRVGKTALAARFRTGKFESGYTRSGPETVTTTSSVVRGARVKFTIHDMPGSRSHQPGREVAYREADVFLLCYRISDPASLFSAIQHWVPEVRRHAPATPLLLIGCQADLRADRSILAELARRGCGFVSPDQARGVGQQAGAAASLETSARGPASGPEAVFQLAAQVSLDQCVAPARPAWDQLSAGSAGSSSSVPRSPSLSSSLDSMRSSLSLPRPASPAAPKRGPSLRGKAARPDSTVTIRCQRLTKDRTYEEVEIEVPAPIFETLRACNSPGEETLARGRGALARLRALFLRA
jgi:small GTP-binding protein